MYCCGIPFHCPQHLVNFLSMPPVSAPLSRVGLCGGGQDKEMGAVRTLPKRTVLLPGLQEPRHRYSTEGTESEESGAAASCSVIPSAAPLAHHFSSLHTLPASQQLPNGFLEHPAARLAFKRKDARFLPKHWFPQEPTSLDTKWPSLNMIKP